MRKNFSVLLAAALLAVLTGAQIEAQPVTTAPTFAKDVAPILYKQCVTCHRPGEAAPMSLLTYEQARPYARAIANAVANRTMPPWHADAPAGTFHNERLMSDAERQTLSAWSATGALQGDAKDLPPAPAFVEGWSLGKPDIVLEMQEDYSVPARGVVEYEYLYIPTNFAEAKWVKSIEIRPGTRKAVHHVLVYYHAKPDIARAPLTKPKSTEAPEEVTKGQHLHPRKPPAEGVQRRLIATYAPGTNPQVFPLGTAMRLPPGGVLHFQMHYTAIGKPGTDRSKVGLIFAKEPPATEMRASAFLNTSLVIPPGSMDQAVSTEVTFAQDAVVWGLFPHTHVRGKRWNYVLTLPDGTSKTILAVPKYDFNWKTYYMFSEPLQIPKGARIVSTAWYDNSAANRSNPDPSIEVHWGDQTWEEMQYTGILYSARAQAR